MDGQLQYQPEHDDVIKWKHFPRYWPFVRGIHRSPVNSQHKGQWRGALMFSLIYAWINNRVNNRGAGDLRRYRAHYDVIVMILSQDDWADQLLLVPHTVTREAEWAGIYLYHAAKTNIEIRQPGLAHCHSLAVCFLMLVLFKTFCESALCKLTL